MRAFFVTVWLSLAISTLARADHVPEWIVVDGAPESVLAGITPGTTGLDEVCRVFGEPARRVEDPRFPGEADYIWNQGGAEVRVSTMFDADTTAPRNEVVMCVQVSGTSSDARLRTSKGARLGATLPQLIRTYGKRYTTNYLDQVSKESLTVTFTFRTEAWLDAGFRDEGTVCSLRLCASAE